MPLLCAGHSSGGFLYEISVSTLKEQDYLCSEIHEEPSFIGEETEGSATGPGACERDVPDPSTCLSDSEV